jgi:hypothetical protein
MRNDSAVRIGLLLVASAIAAVTTTAPVIGQKAQTGQSPVGGRGASTVARDKAAAWTLPRTPDGHPDLQGVWNFATATPLERPLLGNCNTTIDDPRLGQPCDLAGKEELSQAEVAEFEKRVTTAADADRRDGSQDAELARAYNNAWFDDGRTRLSSNRTSLVVDPPDGRIPELTAAARQRQAARAAAPNRDRMDGPEDRPATERCLSFNAGPPMLPSFYNNNLQIVQGPGYVVLLNEMIHDARVIPIDGRRRVGSGIRQWMGDSVGHWDGNTLVVETSQFTDRTSFRGSTQNLRLTERFTRVSASTVNYRFTLDDPDTWVRPWTGEFPLRKTDEGLYEYACHEGNYGIVGVLNGARAAEQEANGATDKK